MKLLSVICALFLLALPARADETFPAFMNAAPAIGPPYNANDWVPVVRGAVTYHAPANTSFGGIAGPPTSTINEFALWNDALGQTLKNGAGVNIIHTGGLSVQGLLQSSSIAATGIGGAGYLQLPDQTLTPAPWPSSLRLYSNTSDQPAWVNSSGLNHTIIGSAPPTVYVRIAGNDANDCLSPGAACATINHAITVGTLYWSVGGANLVVDIGAGAFNESVAVNYPLTGAVNSASNPNGTNSQPGQIVLSGAGSGSTFLTGTAFCGTVMVSNYAVVGVRAMTLDGNGDPCQSTLFAQLGATINIYDDIVFGPASVEQIHIENAGSQVQAWFSYTISGGAVRHITAANGLYLHSAFPSGVITLVGPPTFTNEFVAAAEGGVVQFNSGVSFVGTFIGKRYNAFRNGVIRTDPSTSLTWLPGTIAGTVYSGGIYGTTDYRVTSEPGNTNVLIYPQGSGLVEFPISTALAAPISGAGGPVGINVYMLTNAHGYIDSITSGASVSSLHLRSYAGSGVYNDLLFDSLGQLSWALQPNASAIAVTGYSLTGADVHSLVNMTGTLNTAGVVPVLRYSITDTAHGGGSLYESLTGGAGGVTVIRSLDMLGNEFLKGNLNAATLQTSGYTIAAGAGQLPAPGVAGRNAYVTDQAAACPAPGAALTAGGAFVCPVFDNGAAWVGG